MCITSSKNIAIELLKTIGRLSASTARRLDNCASVTGHSVEHLLTICGAVSQFEVNTLQQAVKSFIQEDFGFVKTALILRQSIAMHVEYDKLLTESGFGQLSPVCLYLLECGFIRLSQIQQIQLMMQTKYLPVSEIDGNLLCSNGYINIAQWRTAVVDLRLLETGQTSIETLEKNRNYSLTYNNSEGLFGSHTWLIGEDALDNPILLNYIELSLTRSKKLPDISLPLCIPVTLDMQRLIVALKTALRRGQIGQKQALDLARIAYTTPDMIWSLSTYLAAHIEHWQQLHTTREIANITPGRAQMSWRTLQVA